MVDVTGEPKAEREQLAGRWSITSHTAWQLEEGSEAFRCCSAADADRWAQQPGSTVSRIQQCCCAAATLIFSTTSTALTLERSAVSWCWGKGAGLHLHPSHRVVQRHLVMSATPCICAHPQCAAGRWCVAAARPHVGSSEQRRSRQQWGQWQRRRV